jgi:predicted nuclease with TOPRIM domain
MNAEPVLCKVISALTDNPIYELKNIDPTTHLQPILYEMDTEFFSKRFTKPVCDWTKIVEESANYLSLNGIEGGLEYDPTEDLKSPTENFIYSVIVQILSIYWLYTNRLDEYLKTIDNEDYQVFYECVAPFKNVVAEAVARQFNRMSKASEQDIHEGNTKAMFHLQQQVQDLMNTNKLQTKAIQDYINKIAQISLVVEDRDKEIKALKEIEEIANIEKEAIAMQRENLNIALEKLKGEHNDLHERYIRQEDEHYRLLTQVENLENTIKALRTQELIYQSKERAYEEANQKLKAYDDLKNDYEAVKAANEEKKQFIMYLHSKNKELQATMVTQMDTIIELEKTKNILEISNQNLQAQINVLENQSKTLRNENLIYKNYNRNLLANEYLSDANGSRRPTKLDFVAPSEDDHDPHLRAENLKLRREIKELKDMRETYNDLLRSKQELEAEAMDLRVKLQTKDVAINNLEREFQSRNEDLKSGEKAKAILAQRERELRSLSQSIQNMKREFETKEHNYQTLIRKNDPTEGGTQTESDLLEIHQSSELNVLYGAFMGYVKTHLDIGSQIRDRNVATSKQLTTYFSMGKLLIPDQIE